MRTRAARAGIAAAAVAAAVGLFFALARDDSGAGSPTTQPQAVTGASGDEASAGSATTETQSPPEAEAEPAPPPAPRIERIVVRDGRPVGGVKRLEYARGDRVRFSVRSDVADEVHVHGFDLTKDVPANRNVRFRFTADLEGVFEVELHHAHVAIAELRIGP